MELSEQLRSKDQAVLKHIQDGNNDIQKITEATTLENHEVNYCFTKLADLQLINITKPDQMIERRINGQKHVFQHPKQAALTDKAKQYLNQEDTETLPEYEDLTRKELVEKIHELEGRVNELESSFEVFRKQVRERL